MIFMIYRISLINDKIPAILIIKIIPVQHLLTVYIYHQTYSCKLAFSRLFYGTGSVKALCRRKKIHRRKEGK